MRARHQTLIVIIRVEVRSSSWRSLLGELGFLYAIVTTRQTRGARQSLRGRHKRSRPNNWRRGSRHRSDAVRRPLTTIAKEFLLSLVSGKMVSGMEGKLALGLCLVAGREILLELRIELLGQLVMLARMQRNLLYKTLSKLFRCRGVGRDTEMGSQLRSGRGYDGRSGRVGMGHSSLWC